MSPAIKFIYFIFLVAVVWMGCVYPKSVYAEESAPNKSSTELVMPVYVSKSASINDFNLFANSGWDGNWYVGGNTCWIQKLVLPNASGYKKAFVGAKLGRMKSQNVADNPPWVKSALPGSIYMAVSSTYSWQNSDCFHLVDAEDIPLEGDAESAINGTGEARWFWREVPVSSLNFGGDNYLALYSNNMDFNSAQNSPILSAAYGNQEPDTWLNDEIKGVPPKNDPLALKTNITYFEPAIAIKLVPENKISLDIGVSVEHKKPTEGDKLLISALVSGVNIEQVWMEVSTDYKKWAKLGGYLCKPPYHFVIDKDNSPIGKYWLRVSANDEFGNKAYSKAVELYSEKK